MVKPMKKHSFRPSVDDVLEDRLALSHPGAAAMAHVAHIQAKGPPVLRTAALNDVNRKIDAAFTQFDKQYAREVAQLGRNGDQVRFQTALSGPFQK
jgi:hypothetical protein